MGLGLDDWDMDYYTQLFRDEFQMDPTDVELFDMAQSNSEHSRHWFFGGILKKPDGSEYPTTLFKLVKVLHHKQTNYYKRKITGWLYGELSYLLVYI